MSLPLFFDKKPRYTVFGQNECTGRLQKVVENQVSVSLCFLGVSEKQTVHQAS